METVEPFLEKIGLSWWLRCKESACSAGDPGSVPGLGRFPGEGTGSPLQYSCLGNPMYREAWWATVHGVTKSWTQLSRYLSILSILPGRVSVMGNISLLIKFKKKRSLEVYRYISFCLFTRKFIKD